MANSTNRHLSEADDRFVEALLEEHARLGSGDDLALLALIRARTEEQPETGRRTSSNHFGVRQWLQVAAVVTLIGVVLTIAFRHLAPGNSSQQTGKGIVSAPTASSTDKATPEPPEYTIRIKNGATAPQAPTTDAIGAALTEDNRNAVSNLFGAEWQSPITHPLSIIPSRQDMATDNSGTLSLEEMHSVLATGNPLPAGAVTVSSILEQLPLTKPEDSEENIRLSAATCPWNNDHQLVHVHVDSANMGQVASMFSKPNLLSEGRFPVFSQIDSAFPQSIVALSAANDEIDKELIRIALAQITEMALGVESGPSPELVIEFNPAQVSNYRLLGHATNFEGQLTALYEIKDADRTIPDTSSQGTDLKYQPTDASDDLLTVQFSAEESSIAHAQTSQLQQADDNLRLTAAAALFAEMVNSGRTPSPEQANHLAELLNDAANNSPEAIQFQDVVALWSRSDPAPK